MPLGMPLFNQEGFGPGFGPGQFNPNVQPNTLPNIQPNMQTTFQAPSFQTFGGPQQMNNQPVAQRQPVTIDGATGAPINNAPNPSFNSPGGNGVTGFNIPGSNLAPGQPPFGLAGAEDAIARGVLGGSSALQNTQQNVGGTFDQGVSGLQPFVGPGQDANQLQAALSGALGPEAQAQAFQNFQASPGQAFLQEQGERGLLRTAAARGDLGGGNLGRELSVFNQGLALQDLDAQFGRLGDVATRGLSGATTIGGLRGQQAGIQGQLGQQIGQNIFQGGRDVSQLRQQAGRDIQQGISQTTSSLANLINQQGAGTTDILSTGTENINQMIQLAQQGDAAAQEQLAQILANLGIQGASTFGAQPIIPGATTNLLGDLGTVTGGVGGLLSNLPQQQQSNFNIPVQPFPGGSFQ